MRTDKIMKFGENSQSTFTSIENQMPAIPEKSETNIPNANSQRWLPVPIDSNAHLIIQKNIRPFRFVESSYWLG